MDGICLSDTTDTVKITVLIEEVIRIIALLRRTRSPRPASNYIELFPGPGSVQPREPWLVPGPGSVQPRGHWLPAARSLGRAVLSVCVFITAGPMIELCAGGEGDSEGHVL